MTTGASISFDIGDFEGAVSVIPVINGRLLTDMIDAFEKGHQYDPARGYGGLIPSWFKYGPLDRYFLGNFEENSYFEKMGGIYVLGCGDCGEVGCWPLVARVSSSMKSFVWDRFEQPHRKQRDYSEFGPFVFDAKQYRNAVSALCAINS